MTTSSRELVKEALDKAYGIKEELDAANEIALVARNAYNVLRARQDTNELVEIHNRGLALLGVTYTETHDKEVAVAASVLENAQAIYDRAVDAARKKLDLAVYEATSAADDRLASDKKNLDLQAAAAQADAHTEDQKVSVLLVDLTKFCEQTKQNLGVDLQGLLS